MSDELGGERLFCLKVLVFIWLDVGMYGRFFSFMRFGEVLRLSREHFRRSRDCLRESCESFEESS